AGFLRAQRAGRAPGAAACGAAGRAGDTADGRGVGGGQVLAVEGGIDATAGGWRPGTGVATVAATGDAANGEAAAGAGHVGCRGGRRGSRIGVPVAVGGAG